MARVKSGGRLGFKMPATQIGNGLNNSDLFSGDGIIVCQRKIDC